MEVTRRLFLGGAMSLLAVRTFTPSTASRGNLPKLYGNGKDDDTSGLNALFRREPLEIPHDNVWIDSHGGIEFHFGRFRITRTVEVPDDLQVKVEKIEMDVLDLDESMFALRGHADVVRPFTGLFTKWTYYQAPIFAWDDEKKTHIFDKFIRPAHGVQDRRRFIETIGAYDLTDDLVA